MTGEMTRRSAAGQDGGTLIPFYRTGKDVPYQMYFDLGK